MIEIKEIMPEEVQQKLANGEKIELIDVREEEEVEEGMIPQAKHIRMNDIPEHLEAIDKERETILFVVLEHVVEMYVRFYKREAIPTSSIWLAGC